MSAEALLALPEWVAQLRHADPAFNAESILWSPQAGHLHVSSTSLSDTTVKRLREGRFYADGFVKVLLSPDGNWAAYYETRDAEPALMGFDLQAGRILQLEVYPAGDPYAGVAAMGWTKSSRLVVATWSERVDQERWIPSMLVYDLRTMDFRYGLGSPVRFEVTQ
jgi:hypothetical protein